MSRRRAAGLAAAGLTLASCGTVQQSAIDAAGTQAARIEGLWWIFFWLLAGIFVTVIGVLLWALLRRGRTGEHRIESIHLPEAASEKRSSRVVGAAVTGTVLILLLLIVLSVGTGKAISGMSAAKNGIAVEVTGNQWWWQIRYLNDDPSRIVTTANEMHVPVGRPVMIRGMSNDVIHSFWAPNLHGKRDLIPSRVTTEWFQADRPGRYRGQCAEFCGMQHAHMAMWVVAEPEDQYQAWLRNQLKDSVQPEDPVRQRGQQVFLSNACAFCHRIQGTTAAGQTGPDLTHLASRQTIAAGTLPNNRGNLGGWIMDPQSIKPGNHMASVSLNPEDLQPLLEYLESLR